MIRILALLLLYCLMTMTAYAQAPATLDERVEALLEQMTLEEKVGQMTQLTLQTVTRQQAAAAAGPTAVQSEGEGGRLAVLDPDKLRRALVDYHVGSLLNVVDHAFPLEHWRQLITQIQDVATDETRLGIPVLYGVDAVHGANYLTGGTLYPHNIGLAATFDTALVRRANAVTAAETRGSGIPWNFSPVLDLGRQPLWPRFYETFGEDVLVARRLGAAAVRGLQGRDVSAPDRVAACAKHYVGYSVPESGRDRTTAWIPERQLRELHLPAFQAAIDQGVRTVMVNSGDVNGIPVHASRYLLTDVLRGELGFDGLVVTDWEDIIKLHRVHRTAASTREATRQALEAGIDMAMVPNDFSFYHDLMALVEEGAVSEARLDTSVRRILHLKMELGLFDDPYPGPFAEADVHAPAHEADAREAARRSLTLLENEGDVLPLAADARVLVTGPAAHSLTALNGGWTYTWQGTDPSAFPEDELTLLEALRERLGADRVDYVPGATFDSLLDARAAAEAARRADVAVVAVGEDAYAEKPGDIDDLSLPEAQRALVQAVAAAGTPVVLVLVEGRPRLLHDAADAADAVLMAYWPGMEGGRALADVLVGDHNPGGRLPFTYPRHAHNLLTYDHPVSSGLGIWLNEQTVYRPQWPFGHGLSYTSFAYDDLIVDPSATPHDTVRVEVTVRNTGDRPGRETVLLYVADEYASVAPAIRRLRAFAPVELAPGEQRRVAFELAPDDLAFVGLDQEWTVEPGTFRVEVGGLSDSFELLANGARP